MKSKLFESLKLLSDEELNQKLNNNELNETDQVIAKEILMQRNASTKPIPEIVNKKKMSGWLIFFIILVGLRLVTFAGNQILAWRDQNALQQELEKCIKTCSFGELIDGVQKYIDTYIKAKYTDKIKQGELLISSGKIFETVKENGNNINLLNDEFDKIDLSELWDQKNFYDKNTLDHTEREFSKFVVNQKKMNQVVLGMHEELLNEIKTEKLPKEIDDIFMEFYDGYAKGEKAKLIVRRQEIRQNSIVLITKVISIYKKNFGKMIKQNNNYVFDSEEKANEYNKLIAEFVKGQKEWTELNVVKDAK